MGEQNIEKYANESARQAFMKSLLEEVRALDAMLDKGMVESGVSRIGAEQEMFLIDRAHKPARKALELLEAINDDRFTHELGLFNLEVNLSPRPSRGAHRVSLWARWQGGSSLLIAHGEFSALVESLAVINGKVTCVLGADRLSSMLLANVADGAMKAPPLAAEEL